MVRSVTGCIALLLMVFVALPLYADTAPLVRLSTGMGEIDVELYPDEAPVTVENFLAYVDSGFYDMTIFHRVVKGFVIQGGGFELSLHMKETRDPIKNEASNGLSNLAMTLAMARTPEPDSATSQFFINLVDNPALDYSATNPGYAVFGKVVKGQDVVEAVAALDIVSLGQFTHLPDPPVIIKKASRIESKPEPDPTDPKDPGEKSSDSSGCFMDVLSFTP
ncbi:peptidyl-prolyl cis-trans isomerase A (cyclophilin A)/peptidyl-prolyl cis-trans isomerase B (cyclophilin B) [Desulfobotulus alkaliphilus]|uniref:Peptidyl-prolyl cis-trans isomerase n=1 Tax=Desulfobotulus alkaliphilus TaxID=622671 RepID=A0A562R274_9BACT|nr:peptidylprolyl isomerase [Desulfobotulus alkaliphilus]TWI63158.1 peptidyl-prolyl cis-trans isomerase A (cyclophilin A)/peptidyl-prolyl cis-trans isomerase B (cyclophilin B) [Desulfobotulus alkaliphilus]